MSTEYELLSVFVGGQDGGNAVPVFPDAHDLSDEQMKDLACKTGLESAFFLPAQSAAHTGQLRYRVPNHEMSMCGHATIGTAWLLNRLGWQQPASGYLFDTAAGLVRAGADDHSGWFEQATGGIDVVNPLATIEALEALGLTEDDLAGVAQNSAAPRVKTLIPLNSTDVLDRLDPDARSVKVACEALGSTGLYPYVMTEPALAHARQFPKSSGYLEDPATGIAAAALFFGLQVSAFFANEQLVVLQGQAMGRPSRIVVEATPDTDGLNTCRVSGTVEQM